MSESSVLAKVSLKSANRRMRSRHLNRFKPMRLTQNLGNNAGDLVKSRVGGK
ncbi:MAG: hypothetical protein RIE73_33200 [Coleofasciculus sp. C1-SOL-03]|uniref:hypothetical protein n=1 Tax=Coleofasciculus sp. C1-SOL-03 TaxID=3069522 RepID=UPI0032FF7C7C